MRNWSNMAVLLTTILILMLYSLSVSEARYLKKPTSFKQARAIRGFKSMPLQVGRGFGKRADFQNDLNEDDLVANIDALPDNSFPVEWIADKMDANPAFARSVLRKFVDSNGDDQLSLEELFRPVY